MLRPWTKHAAVALLACGLTAGSMHAFRSTAPLGDDTEPSIVLQPTWTYPAPGLCIVRPQSVVGDVVRWESLDAGMQLIPNDLLKNDQSAVGFASSPGVYRIRAIAAKNVGGLAHMSPFVDTVITIGTPTPPVPPVPPTPPTPPTPIPGNGFRVLILHPSDPNWKPDPGVLDAMRGGDVQAYLRSKTVKVDNVPEFRIWPENVDVSKQSKVWQDAVAKAKADSGGKLPWVLVANTDKGTSQAVPADQASMLKLLQSIGG